MLLLRTCGDAGAWHAPAACGVGDAQQHHTKQAAAMMVSHSAAAGAGAAGCGEHGQAVCVWGDGLGGLLFKAAPPTIAYCLGVAADTPIRVAVWVSAATTTHARFEKPVATVCVGLLLVGATLSSSAPWLATSHNTITVERVGLCELTGYACVCPNVRCCGGRCGPHPTRCRAMLATSNPGNNKLTNRACRCARVC